MFRVPRNPCRFIPLVSNGYNEKESQRRTSAQIRKRKAQGAADREDGRSRLLRPARQGAGGRSHLGRIRPDGALKERRPPAPHGRTDDPAAAARRYGQQPQSARPGKCLLCYNFVSEEYWNNCTALIEKIDTLIDQINE